MKSYFLFSIAVLTLIIGTGFSYGASGVTYIDDFKGPVLNSNIWFDSDGDPGGLLLKNGYLITSGQPEYTRIETKQKLSVTGSQITAGALVSINGDYQKFGFRPNSTDFTGPISGYYFDTYQRGQSGAPGDENYIYAVAWYTDEQGNDSKLLEEKLPMTWNTAHLLSITRTGTNVKYFIDGILMTSIAVDDSEALPIAIYNDRPGIMVIDKVIVKIS